jgi:glycerol-3-phosphate acyltransferase PlsY
VNPFSPDASRFVALWVPFWFRHGWVFLLAAFLIGSIPFGLVVSRVFFGRDLRASGSGNIGAANALRTMGRGAGLAVLVLDALKGVVATALPAVAIDQHWFQRPYPFFCCMPDEVAPILCAMCAIAAILGHCYSPWLRFNGGKGVATLLGVLIVAYWPSALVFVAVWLAVVLPTGFASLGSILGTLASIAVIGYYVPAPTLYFTVPAAAIIIWKHRQNITRLLSGKENRLNLINRKEEPA